MVTVYQIEISSEAPRLDVLHQQDAALLVFNGERKADKWPVGGLQVKSESFSEDLFQFYRLGVGALIYREDVIEVCDDFYWIATQNIEPLHLVSGKVIFNLMNIIDFMDPLRPGEPGYESGAPCQVDSFYAPIIKMKGRSPSDLYSVSGLTNPMNEFKAVYDHFGFKGLTFNEVWSGNPLIR